MNQCLYCYQPLEVSEGSMHKKCSKKIFGQPTQPLLPYSEDQMEELAVQVIKSSMTVTGVQPKISLHIASDEDEIKPKRFTIVGLWGEYILKPPTGYYPQLPEVEDLTMHLAEIAGIETVPHCLIRFHSGSLAYITRRIDRADNKKLHMEDMCQLTERLTENKYLGSYEQIAKTISRYSSNPMLDVVTFYEQVLFSFLTGNADMHLKNFSLIKNPVQGYILSPAYDLVATALVNPADDEELALTLNGKKKKIIRNDFMAAFNNSGLTLKQQENLFRKMQSAKSHWMDFIDISFINHDLKIAFKELIKERFKKLEL